MKATDNLHPAISRPQQNRFLDIPQSPVCYWLPPSVLSALPSPERLLKIGTVNQGIHTLNNNRYVRFFWEVQDLDLWICYEKGGGYRKWYGFQYYVVRESLVVDQIGDKKITYTDVARGNMGARLLPAGHGFDVASPGITPVDQEAIPLILTFLNNRLSSYIFRAICPSFNHIGEGYVNDFPLPQDNFTSIDLNHELPLFCITLKKEHLSNDILEHFFFPNEDSFCRILTSLTIQIFLLTAEALIENNAICLYGINDTDRSRIISDTGTPAGWYPLITGYDDLPPLPDGLPEIPAEVQEYLDKHDRMEMNPTRLIDIKSRLFTLYEAGPGANVEFNDEEGNDDGDENTMSGAYNPIPPETFLEELSQKLQIHPISVYWLLKEGIKEEGWRCIPEERRILEDRLTVLILRILGHRWPKQIEAEEPVPEWADRVGILPMQEVIKGLEARGWGLGNEEELAPSPQSLVPSSWLERDFFKHHTSQFKKRPIAWQIQSSNYTAKRKPAFACLVYYHKLDADLLPKLRSQFVGPLRQRHETELRGIEDIPLNARSDRQHRRKVELEELIAELKEFDKKLEDVSLHGFASPKLREILEFETADKWCSIDGIKPPPPDSESLLRQESRYFPDINDGVRVNIAPLQKAGLLASNVLAPKDVDKAIQDRAEWRSDERRWCREGKLPKPGWWTDG